MKRALLALLLLPAMVGAQVDPSVVNPNCPHPQPMYPSDVHVHRDTTSPTIVTRDPGSSGPIAGNSYTLNANTNDGVGCGIREACFYYVYCGVEACEAEFSTATLIGCTSTSDGDDFSYLWTFPSCAEAPNAQFNVWFQTIDYDGNTREMETDDLVLNGRGC
jgi:hypothetical protein